MKIKTETENDDRFKCGEIFMQLSEKSLTLVCLQCNQTFKELATFGKHLFEEIERNKQDTPSFKDDDEHDLLEPMHTMYLYEEVEQPLVGVVKEEPIETSRRSTRKKASNPTSISNDSVAKNRLKKKPQKTHCCTMCEKAFSRPSHLRRHLYSHTHGKRFPCDECTVRCSSQQKLNSHKLKHTGEKTFFCSNCPAKFKTSSDLKTHTRYHTGERPHICEECGKGHTTSSHLLSHRRRMHMTREEFKCEMCSKTLSSSYGLRTHIFLVHSDAPRNKECDICGATFKAAKTLREHKKIHEEKSYLCKVCGKSFAQKPGLYTHMKTHNIVEKSTV